MPISVQCDQCGKTLKVPDTAAGKRGKCPCGAILVIPAAGGIQPAAAAAARAPAAAPRRSAAKPPAPSADDTGDAIAPTTFQKLWKIYLLSLVAQIVLGLLATILLIAGISSAAASVESGTGGGMPITLIGAIAVFVLMGLISVVGVIAFYVLIYKAWALIQDGNPSTTPLMAILLLFVPVFSIYWIFVAFWGLAKDLNTYAREKGIDARPASEGMVLWGLILQLLGCTAAIGIVLMILGFNSIKNTCVDIATAKGE